MHGRLLLLLLLLTACTSIPPDAEDTTLQERADQVFWDGVIQVHEKELLRAELAAGRMEQFRKKSEVKMMDSVVVTTWDSLGRIESILLCDTLYYARDRQDMQAIGSVRVLAASDPEGHRLEGGRALGRESLLKEPPFRLETDQLEWVQRIQKIRTELPVDFYTPLDTLYGIGFRSDRDLRNWDIRDVTGVSHRKTETDP